MQNRLPPTACLKDGGFLGAARRESRRAIRYYLPQAKPAGRYSLLSLARAATSEVFMPPKDALEPAYSSPSQDL